MCSVCLLPKNNLNSPAGSTSDWSPCATPLLTFLGYLCEDVLKTALTAPFERRQLIGIWASFRKALSSRGGCMNYDSFHKQTPSKHRLLRVALALNAFIINSSPKAQGKVIVSFENSM